jgi:cysteine desulfurase/selenocysteine lyase
MNSSYNVEKIRGDFPILKREIRGKPLVYLDNAASSLKPIQVIDRMSNYYRMESSNVHRGAHYLSSQGTIAYEGARETIAHFLHARSAAEIIFTRGTTEGINLVAQTYGRQNVGEGDEILISELEHHSNIVPWQMLAQEKKAHLKIIPVTDRGEIDFEAYLKLLSNRTKLVALNWCSNTLGTITPIKKFIAAAHQRDIKVLVDAAQGVSSLITDVQELDCDFLVFSGHKIFAPYGIGVLYGKAELLEAMPPYQGGGSMIANVSFENTTYAQAPQKFEAGTPSIADAIGLASAIDYLLAIGLKAAEEYEQKLLTYATQKLKEIPGLKIIGEAADKIAVISFVIDGIHASDLGSLIDNEGIAIRTGHHCTQPLMKRFKVPATARASFSIYNTPAEIDFLQKSLIKAKEFF